MDLFALLIIAVLILSVLFAFGYATYYLILSLTAGKGQQKPGTPLHG